MGRTSRTPTSDALASIGKQLPLLKPAARPKLTRDEYLRLLRLVHLRTASADDRRAAREFERAMMGANDRD